MSSQEIRQITKEAPEIEARKLGLMDSAKELADIQLDSTRLRNCWAN